MLLVFLDPAVVAELDSVWQFVFSFENDDLILWGDLVLWDDLHDDVLVHVVAFVVEDYNYSQEIEQFRLLVQLNVSVVGQVNDVMYDVHDFAFLDQFHVVIVHFFVKVDGSNIELQMALGNPQQIFKLLLVFVMVPNQHSQEIISRMKSSSRQGTGVILVVFLDIRHDLDELDDEVVMVLTLDKVLV
jgi:hypothetical protein